MPGFNISTTGGCDNKSGGGGGKSSAAQGPSNTLETARKHRYEVTITGVDAQYTMACKRIDRPTAEMEMITFHQGQDETYRPGKNKWMPINIELYELQEKAKGGSKSTAKAVYDWMFGKMVDLSKSIIKDAKGGYKTDVIIALTDGQGDTVWNYKLLGAWPLKKQPSELDYGSSEIATLTATVAYDKAIELEKV